MQIQPNERIAELVIRNDLAELATVTDALNRILEGSAISNKALMQLQVALDEILSNVVKYAWPEGETHEVRVRINAQKDVVEVIIVDDGKAFDPRAQAPPKPPPAGRRPRPGGVGIHMVRQLVDSYDYARIEGRNQITLTKRFAPELPPRNKEKFMTSPLNVAETHSGRVCIVSLAGRIDSTNAQDLTTRLSTLISSGEKSILVDLASVLYLTSAAFRTLLVATDEAERNAASFALCSVTGQVRELFEMGGLLDAFTILGSRDEALARLT
jgi:anti-anti-sigma factor